MNDPIPPTPPDLGQLKGDYDIVGELGGPSASRNLIATRRSSAGNRRDDDGRVLIEIVQQPEGDEAHALDHLASDTKILSSLRHRRLIPILEGRWLGDDAYAVIRERIDDPSVAEMLAQGETFTNTRTAAILREVHGLLDWAREQNIVHRRLTPDRIFLEPMSDRVRIAFAAGPLPRIRTTDAAVDDTLTVVRLAMAMLTSHANPADYEGRSLAEMRPDLPERLLEETETLLDDPLKGTDVHSFLALIGMADPMAEGESERDRVRAEVLEEQRVEREKLANERAEFERHMEEERGTLAAEGEELRRIFAQEKATLERAFAEAQQRIVVERAQMQRILADERAVLVARRTELERDVAARRAAIEYAAAADRLRINELRAEIQRLGEMEVERKRHAALEELDDSEIKLDTGDLRTPSFIPPIVPPLDEITFRDFDPLAPSKRVSPTPRLSGLSQLEEAVASVTMPRPKRGAERRWAVPAAIAAAIVLLVTSAILLRNRPTGAASPGPTAAVRTLPVAAVHTGSPAATPRSGAPAARPGAPAAVAFADSAVARRWLDSLRAAYPMDLESAMSQAEAAQRSSARAAAAVRAATPVRAARTAAQAEASAADSIARLVPGARIRSDAESQDAAPTSPDTATTSP
jgi:hypothetical protein